MVGEAEAEEVRGDAPVVALEPRDTMAVIEGPGRIPVEEENRRAVPLVHVVHAPGIEVEIVRVEGIIGETPRMLHCCFHGTLRRTHNERAYEGPGRSREYCGSRRPSRPTSPSSSTSFASPRLLDRELPAWIPGKLHVVARARVVRNLTGATQCELCQDRSEDLEDDACCRHSGNNRCSDPGAGLSVLTECPLYV